MKILQKIRSNIGRIFLGLIFLWFIVTLFVVLPRLNDSFSVCNEDSERPFAKKLQDLEQRILQSNNFVDEMQHILNQFLSNNNNHNRKELLHIQTQLEQLKYGNENFNKTIPIMIPKLEYEKIRKRISENLKEFWFLINSVLNNNKDKIANFQNINDLINEQKSFLLNDMELLSEYDQFESWRKQEMDALSNLVQKRLEFLQNPEDCKSAKKLKCNLNKACGYGCQIHHVVYCLIAAYATKRTLILESANWRYYKSGWNGIFKPISDTCTNIGASHIISWPADNSYDVINLPIIDSINPKPKFLPLTVPDDLAPRLKRLHGNPIIWWIGQFLKYLLRPVPELEQFLNNTLKKIHFAKPIVGIHVRRTDKIGSEAGYHKIEEYMQEADYYYQQIGVNKTFHTKRVFIATDDPNVLNEARIKFPDYEILGDIEIAKSASISQRYSDSSLKGIIFDIYALSLTDYLVCTFSSQVCRMAYELMQTYEVDASSKFRSLDDIFYYGGQNDHNLVVILPHKASNINEIDLEVGDLIGIEGNHWNGYSKGLNRRTNKSGLFPSFKVAEKIETYAFPTYPEVPDF